MRQERPNGAPIKRFVIVWYDHTQSHARATWLDAETHKEAVNRFYLMTEDMGWKVQGSIDVFRTSERVEFNITRPTEVMIEQTYP